MMRIVSFLNVAVFQSPAVGGIKPTLAPTPPGCQITNILKHEPKPVECNLCHRKFKNIPALNGHMRLHGGYFKKVRNLLLQGQVGNCHPLLHFSR